MDARFHNALPIGNIAAKKLANPAPPTAMGAKGKLAERGVEYFHQHVPNLQSDTLLWHPNLWLATAAGEVHFDVGSGQTTYRVLLLGHGPHRPPRLLRNPPRCHWAR